MSEFLRPGPEAGKRGNDVPPSLLRSSIMAEMRFSPVLLITLALAACEKSPPPVAETPAPTPAAAPRATPFTGFNPPGKATQSGSWMWDKNRASNPLGSPAGHDNAHK
jgi:hypothetical protein